MNYERVKAVAVIVVTAIVNILNVYGYAVDMDSTVNAVLSILSAVSILYSWWFNQNVTEEAQEAQAVLNNLKSIRKDSGVSVKVATMYELTDGKGANNDD